VAAATERNRPALERVLDAIPVHHPYVVALDDVRAILAKPNGHGTHHIALSPNDPNISNPPSRGQISSRGYGGQATRTIRTI
jgi:hypothetical protein